jgi:hypothetical protein
LQNDRLAPKMVEGLNGKRIRFIACGSFHTIAITGPFPPFALIHSRTT